MAAIQQRLQSGSEAEDGDFAPVDEIVGFICGTLTAAERLTHHSMQHHEKEGRTLCIHSVSSVRSTDHDGMSSESTSVCRCQYQVSPVEAN